jgi:hypothetical protein
MTEVHDLIFETLTECPVCGWVDIPIIYRRIHYGLPANHAQCGSCGQIFLNPRMTDEQTESYYRGDYRDIMGGMEQINVTDLERQAKRSAFQIRETHELIGNCETALEIGCSAGYLMAGLAEQGMQVIGIEPDERYHRIEPASRFTVYAGLGDLYPYPFDLIAMSHVLEHINRPVEYMRHLLKHYTDPNALIMVEVPNIEIMPHFSLIHHPVSYTADTLRALFHRLGCDSLMVKKHDLGRAGDMYLLGIFRRGE